MQNDQKTERENNQYYIQSKQPKLVQYMTFEISRLKSIFMNPFVNVSSLIHNSSFVKSITNKESYTLAFKTTYCQITLD